MNGERRFVDVSLTYHLLWALCFAALPLSVLACGLGRAVRRAASAATLAIALSLFYLLWMWLLAANPSTPPVPPLVEAWLPNMAFLFAACTLMMRRRRSNVT